MFYDALFIVVAAVAALLLLLGLKLTVRSGWLAGWLRGMAGAALLALAGLLLLLALDLRHYRELAVDEPLATVSFQKLAPQQYRALLLVGDETVPYEFRLAGDQWQMDARILRFSGVWRTIGGKPGYRLERISGRYIALQDELSKERSVFSLVQEPKVFDVWSWLYASRNILPGIDAIYGSATYVPMADQATYQVGLSGSGLVAQPLNDAAKSAVNAW